jgi:hypothetical protein
MRLYVFTKRERAIVERFLNGTIPITDRALSQIRTRLKQSRLHKDVELFLKFDKALTESESAVST